MTRLSALLFATLALFAVGCNSQPYQTVPVSGVVTLDGEPLAGARLSFQPTASSATDTVGPGSTGVSDEQGRFTLETVSPIHDGAVVGTHLVRISTGKTESDADNARILGEKVPPHYLRNQVKIVKTVSEPTDSLTVELFTDRRQAEEAARQQPTSSRADGLQLAQTSSAMLPSKIRSFAVCFLLPLASAGFAADPDATGFVPLFDGKTLDGWVNINCAPETWTVVDGMIHCTGVPTGAMRTERQYENFVLDLEWRHLKPGGNAGLFIWAGPISAPGVPFLRSIEVQILDHAYGESDWFTTHGDVFPIHGSTMIPDEPSRGQRSFPRELRSNGSPEWNHYRVTCIDGVLTLAVNGVVVSGGRDCRYRKGYIALESEGGVVDYRNLRIRELPPSQMELPPEDVAPVAQGFHSLYSGLDLRGWSSDDEAWQARDWTLACAAGDDHALTSETTYRDIEFVFDYRFVGEGAANGTIAVSLPGVEETVALPAGERGAWRRAYIIAEGDSLTLRFSGDEEPVTRERTPPAAPAPLVLLHSGDAAQFAGLYVREL